MFSAVASLRTLVNSSNSGKGTELAFVTGRARVAPMKALTVPKLEHESAHRPQARTPSSFAGVSPQRGNIQGAYCPDSPLIRVDR